MVLSFNGGSEFNCPVCEKSNKPCFDFIVGDGCCVHCGSPFTYVKISISDQEGRVYLFFDEEVQSILSFLSKFLNIDANDLRRSKDVRVYLEDSLDVVEITMEIEERISE